MPTQAGIVMPMFKAAVQVMERSKRHDKGEHHGYAPRHAPAPRQDARHHKTYRNDGGHHRRYR
jgi:hypothetical protein